MRAKEKFRAADHPFRLSFIDTTSVRPVSPQHVAFPLIAHNALPFSELEKRIGSNVLMSDWLMYCEHVVRMTTSFWLDSCKRILRHGHVSVPIKLSSLCYIYMCSFELNVI